MAIFVGFGPMLLIYRWLCFRHFYVIRFSVFVFVVTHYLYQHLFFSLKIYSQMIIICMYGDTNSFRQSLTRCIYFHQIKRHHNNIQDMINYFRSFEYNSMNVNGKRNNSISKHLFDMTLYSIHLLKLQNDWCNVSQKDVAV